LAIFKVESASFFLFNKKNLHIYLAHTGQHTTVALFILVIFDKIYN